MKALAVLITVVACVCAVESIIILAAGDAGAVGIWIVGVAYLMKAGHSLITDIMKDAS